MIDGNILKFGHGDIAVGYRVTGILTFQQFKPPEECGSYVSDNVEYTSEQIIINFTCYEEYLELSNKLKDVKSKNISTFEFKDYIFDFTNYNEKSVEVCERYLKRAMSWYLMCCAA